MIELKIIVIGDYNETKPSHPAINESIRHAADSLSVKATVEWIPTKSFLSEDALSKIGAIDGVWAASGDPESSEGMIAGIQRTRLNGKPFLATCGGFQHTLLEYARNITLIDNAESAERNPNAEVPLITLASCPADSAPGNDTRLQGTMKLRIKPISSAYEAYQKRIVSETFACNYELNPEYRDRLEKSGLRISGRGTDGATRIIEKPGHFFYLATGFLPQLNSEPGSPHPLIHAWLKAAVDTKVIISGINGKPESLEGQWYFLYRDYPEVYDEMSQCDIDGDKWLKIFRKITPFEDKVIADIGSGSGDSSIPVAKYAKTVYAVEPEQAMIDIAIERAKQDGISNIEFIQGNARNTTLGDDSVDITITNTGAFFFGPTSTIAFVEEAKRITRPGGYILIVNTDPNWYGGEMAKIVMGNDFKDTWYATVIERLGFSKKFYYGTMDFGTVDRAVRTFGFIWGKKAIDYFKAHNKTTVKFKYRVDYLRLE